MDKSLQQLDDYIAKSRGPWGRHGDTRLSNRKRLARLFAKMFEYELTDEQLYRKFELRADSLKQRDSSLDEYTYEDYVGYVSSVRRKAAGRNRSAQMLAEVYMDLRELPVQ